MAVHADGKYVDLRVPLLTADYYKKGAVFLVWAFCHPKEKSKESGGISRGIYMPTEGQINNKKKFS